MLHYTVSTTLSPPGIRRLRYLCGYLNEHPLLPPGVRFGTGEHAPSEARVIAYGKQTAKAELSVCCTGQLQAAHHRELDPSVAAELIRVFRTKNCAPDLTRLDLFYVLFFFLSGAEHYHLPAAELDQHGRPDENREWLKRHQLHRIPLLDRLVVHFFKQLQLPVVSRPTRVDTSHDIDFLRRYPTAWSFVRTSGRLLLRDRNWTGFMKLLRRYPAIRAGRLPDPYLNFDWLLTEGNFALRSIYFLVGGDTPFEGHYRPDDPLLPGILQQAQQSGYRIGLHPSYDSSRVPQRIAAEQQILEDLLNRPVRISRQHFLRYRYPHTWRELAQLGIEEDASLGYTKDFGFRAGTGFPFRPYDPEREEELPLLVRPLVLMDIGLIRAADGDLQLADHLAAEFWNENRFNTQVSVNFHNSIFDETTYDLPRLRAIYQRIGGWDEGDDSIQNPASNF